MTLALFGGAPLVDRGRHTKWPLITDADKRAVMEVLDRGILSGSEAPAAKAFEAAFAQAVGAKHALLTHSGTSALQVAISALGIGEGDEVIVPAYSFVASATSVLQEGAIPVFVDVLPESGGMDPSKLEAAITKRTKAIMPVHIHGCPADLGPILEIAKKHGLFVIEDAAQAHLATYQGRPVGTFGHVAAFSMQSSKNLPAGEGGLFVTNDPALLERANRARNFGQDLVLADAAHYDLERPLDGHRALSTLGMGSMYRGNEMMAAFAKSQLARLPELTRRAQENGQRLSRALSALPGVKAQPVPSDRTTVFHKFRVWLDPSEAGLDLSPVELRGAMLKALDAEGCETYLWQSRTLPSFPLFQELRGYGHGFPYSAGDRDWLRANYTASYPGAEALLAGSIVLFSHTCPLIAQDGAIVDQYADAFRKVWEGRARLVDFAKRPKG